MVNLSQIIDCGHRGARKVIETRDTTASYTRDLGLEAMLEFSVASNTPAYAAYVQEICRMRGVTPTTPISYAVQPFSCLTFEMYLHTKDPHWLPGFIEQTSLWRREEVRSEENAVTHPRGPQRGGGQAILIDSLQCYASRMAAAGSVTGDKSFFQECVDQYRIHRHLLRSPATGLWSQGRGWLAAGDKRLSPGAWSRGHGWLIRGLEKSLRYLPPGSPYAVEMTGWLHELADALLAVQSSCGMWHTLLHRPVGESLPDSSGTGMIAAHLGLAWHNGWLSETRYRDAALRALNALPEYVSADGTVLSASPGPGPLETEEPWLAKSFPAGELHGTFAVLFAATTAAMLQLGSSQG